MRSNQQGIAWGTWSWIDQNQAVDVEAKLREGGEESKLHFADLMLAGDIVASYIAHDRGQTLWGEDYPQGGANH